MSEIKVEKYTAKEYMRQYNGTNAKEIVEWTKGTYNIDKNKGLVNSSYGGVVNIGDYIMDSKNTFWPLQFCRVTEQYLRENYDKVQG